MSSRISGHGRSIVAPEGWEARIFRREQAQPVLHLATFALERQDGDFGAAATGRMRPDDAFAALVEYRVAGSLRPGSGLFSAGAIPSTLRAGDFHPQQLQVTRQGHLGCQRFFSYSGRALALYAVLWPMSAAGLRPRLHELNGALETLEIDPPARPLA